MVEGFRFSLALPRGEASEVAAVVLNKTDYEYWMRVFRPLPARMTQLFEHLGFERLVEGASTEVEARVAMMLKTIGMKSAGRGFSIADISGVHGRMVVARDDRSGDFMVSLGSICNRRDSLHVSEVERVLQSLGVEVPLPEALDGFPDYQVGPDYANNGFRFGKSIAEIDRRSVTVNRVTREMATRIVIFGRPV